MRGAFGALGGAALGALLLLPAPAIGGSTGAPGRAEEPSIGAIERALDAVRPALVRLTVVGKRYSEGRTVRFPSSGSGVVVTAAGELVTNFHVAGHAERIRATLATGEIVDAIVVGHDPLTDLSVLRLDLAARAADAPPIEPARFREREPQVGEQVLALGSPLTLASSVTLGIVSNTRRVFTDFTGTRLEEMELEGEPTGLFTRWIQHDALILPGNSGGPLVDLEGRIVGINELGGSGVGFAIPAALARSVLERILADGRVRRADLGWSLLPVSKLSGERARSGALVASVTPGGAAAAAGVVPGDRLLSIDGVPASARFFEEVPELYRRTADLPIGREVTLEVERGGATRTLRATPRELLESVGEEAEVRELGVAVEELTPLGALARQLEAGAGLVVASVRGGSPAALARPAIEPGDLLVEFAGRSARTIAELRAALGAAGRGDRLLVLRRDDQRLLSVVRLEDERSRRAGGELPKPWLGVKSQVMTPALAAAAGSPELRGIRITQVLPWSEAERAGLAAGDVVVAVDGEPLVAAREQDGDALRFAIEARAIGDRVALDLVRAGERKRFELALEARPPDPQEVRSSKQELLGFSVRELTLFDRAELHLEREQKGALVTEVVSGGWAQMAGLDPGDVVLAVDDRPVENVAALQAALEAIVAARPDVISLFVRRSWRTHFVFLEPHWNGVAPAATPAGGR